MSIRNDMRYADALRRICEDTDFLFFTKSWMGLNAFFNPWFEFSSMENCIDHCESPVHAALKLLQLGISADREELAREIDPKDIALMVESGIWREEDGKIATNNLIVIGYEGLLLLTEINPWFPTCTDPNTDVYIGNDSYRLAENISFRRGAKVLDLCSGTGIQGILAARAADKVVSVELNPKAVPVTQFNIRLNRVEDKMEVRQGDLYSVLEKGETFDCIYANPPFIPMPEGVTYPICGAGGEDGLMVLNRIVDGAPAVLNKGGEIVLFCECLGNDDKVFFNDRLEKLGREYGWHTTQLLVSRLEAEHQIVRLSELTKLFDEEGFDKMAFRARLREIYAALGATYLYHLVYRVRADGRGDGTIRKIAQYNTWTPACRARVLAETGGNPQSKGLWKAGRQIGSVNGETEAIMRSLAAGKTVREAAEENWPLYEKKKKYEKEGFPAFLTAACDISLKLESLGAIEKI